MISNPVRCIKLLRETLLAYIVIIFSCVSLLALLPDRIAIYVMLIFIFIEQRIRLYRRTILVTRELGDCTIEVMTNFQTAQEIVDSYKETEECR